ncbi:glycosyltransferase [Fontivita pretiosa]|uniref:glycosyltransferase n=1 Tax=Fontivita pretiosa TaxID=2989684 RepID=UPI003D171794
MARRILLLITDLEIGGTPTVVRELAVRLRPHAHVEVACLGRWGPVAQQIQDSGIAVVALGARGVRDVHVFRNLVRLIRQRRFDTVFSFLIHANAAAAVAKLFCPGVRFIQSIQTTQPWPRWHWWVQRIVQEAAEKVVVPSASAGQAAQKWSDVPHEKIVVIPNAVEIAESIESSRRSAVLCRSPGRRDVVRVGFLGRLDPVKRVGDLVAAISLLPSQYTLHVFGQGQDQPNIEREIARLGVQDRVVLHGTVARPQEAIEQIDVLVLPSEAEGFGLVLIEAMAGGVPVVATDVAGIRDVVRDEATGLLVPARSPELLSRAIRRLVEDEPLRSRLIEAAREDVRRRFTWEVVLPEYLRLLGV